MDLLVVGGSGFLGHHVIEEAARQHWNVTATFWKSDTFPTYASRFGCEAIRHDLLGPTRSWDADVCVYLAGNSDHRASLRSPIDDLRLNAEALNRFLSGFSGALVLMSSAAVYEGHTGRVSPGMRIQPRMPYAISKFASECYAWSGVERGQVPWATVLRLYYAYGPHDRANRLIPRLTKAILDGQDTFHVTSPRGSLLDPLYAEDVGRAALAAAKGRAKGRTLDLCAGQPRTVPDLVGEAASILQSRLRIHDEPRVDETPVRFHSSERGCRTSLGLDAFVSFGDGLRRYLDWLKSLGEPNA
jgi:nucleoside-diphosphate-sugar epimerase